MTALKPRDVPAFLKKRDASKPVVLIYGPDDGLVRERAKILGKQIVEDLNDPFNAIELGDSDLSEIGRLTDEAAALSFMGGERLIRIRQSSDAAGKAVAFFLKALDEGRVQSNALVVIEGGDLKKTNALRKACEASSLAIALPCYAEDTRDVMASVRDLLAAEDIALDDDAAMALASHLGEDRGITRAEVEKLILFVGPKSIRDGAPARLSLEDVRACLTDSAADATFDVIDRTLDGDTRGLSEAMFRAGGAGVSSIAILRIAQGRFLRLLTAQQMVRHGDAPAAAIKKLRPPVFYGQQKEFLDHLNRWPLRHLEGAVAALFEADLKAKSTGLPQQEIIERTLISLCANAARRR
ncbi:DNA polymerase III subunit delta [Parvularcula sp. LCG005]|uniref:DNA polymerase III subunit delta n=1 Tax=Parvularcula sp. LCG005 TaxID=3078805 RepID=UPI002942C27B|nr:DNA polymerase III subunit delta [Parvularcula sp. LCG005]WOI53227.1 DNA polymerase III subunit delta [Parvularcula sp. LCG005]